MSKTVLITGASSGIGEATARRLAADGWRVIAGARREDRLARLAASADGIEVHRLDVTDRADVAEFVDRAVRDHGEIDAFVANAGVMPLSRLDAGLVEEWDRMIDVNVRGLLHSIAAALPHFTRQRRGHFVTIASIGAYQVTPTAAVYCGTKYAARAITEGLRLECDPSIRVTTVSPGVVTSELADTISDPETQEFMRIYRKDAIDPTAIGDAVAYALDQPADVDVSEMIVRPARQR
ncbi:SDR family oxidoreductase [Amycolatopsis sp. Poz14]|uniref:SDR family oxidoreductase n=1 Tax=Amycolatopsis sp. Poz14 TaxID=1447705 RepID=UPI001EE93B5F|nr:SDR family oxidoreductase [Amycolatopsis sp. Poz14]MCG3754571.1 SDR family oxidoreductase [Amycolatopsis sp. Poz14]